MMDLARQYLEPAADTPPDAATEAPSEAASEMGEVEAAVPEEVAPTDATAEMEMQVSEAVPQVDLVSLLSEFKSKNPDAYGEVLSSILNATSV